MHVVQHRQSVESRDDMVIVTMTRTTVANTSAQVATQPLGCETGLDALEVHARPDAQATWVRRCVRWGISTAG